MSKFKIMTSFAGVDLYAYCNNAYSTTSTTQKFSEQMRIGTKRCSCYEMCFVRLRLEHEHIVNPQLQD